MQKSYTNKSLTNHNSENHISKKAYSQPEIVSLQILETAGKAFEEPTEVNFQTNIS